MRRIFAVSALLVPVIAGLVLPPARTVATTVIPGLCDLFPYLPGCPH
ncbi:MAG: hypothetical protein WAL91_06750 [Propionicimonas sp.]